jgi:hypothetical protein
MVQREMNTGEEKKWEGEREKDEIAKRLRLERESSFVVCSVYGGFHCPLRPANQVSAIY